MDRLSSHRATKDVVEKHGFKFSKSLGQNFLIDDNVIDRILAGARLSEGDKIIEVGPGIGTLTREMGKVADKVVAIEIDKTLIPILRETLGEFDNIEVVNQDILKVDVETLVKEKLDGGPVKLVANLPYYITTPIVMKFLEEDIPVTDIVVMVQKEVADRMKKLLSEYNNQEEKTLEDILNFHVKFECIHPFQDGNGRVGRLIMFKECLKYNIVPFIIEDNLKMFYYRGLKEWNNEKGYLTDTCLTAQDRYKAYLDYFRIAY